LKYINRSDIFIYFFKINFVSENMELLDTGKHCSEEFCHQFDFLPVKCKACHKIYCSEHITYESHDCIEAKSLNYKIPTCELCSQIIPFNRSKDLDMCLAEHMQTCQLNDETTLNNTKVQKKLAKELNKCCFDGCRSKDPVLNINCDSCDKKFCIKHRMPEIHKCVRKSPSPTASNHPLSCSQQFRIEKSLSQKYFTTSKF
jgi:AN1-type zinc finger protein 2